VKHWDLIPGERVRLLRTAAVGVPALEFDGVFRFRTTLFAVFERERALFEFYLHDDGGLVFDGFRWRIEGEDRNTRAIIDKEAGWC
jgi:hypothetical protein